MRLKSLKEGVDQQRSAMRYTLSQTLQETSDEMSNKLKESRRKNAEMILEASKRLDIALSELNAVKKESEEERMKEFQKWKELRIDIESSTKSLCGKIDAEPRPMSSTTKIHQMAPNHRLPRLNEAQVL